jgi:hypothetical protein
LLGSWLGSVAVQSTSCSTRRVSDRVVA